MVSDGLTSASALLIFSYIICISCQLVLPPPHTRTHMVVGKDTHRGEDTQAHTHWGQTLVAQAHTGHSTHLAVIAVLGSLPAYVCGSCLECILANTSVQAHRYIHASMPVNVNASSVFLCTHTDAARVFFCLFLSHMHMPPPPSTHTSNHFANLQTPCKVTLHLHSTTHALPPTLSLAPPQWWPSLAPPSPLPPPSCTPSPLTPLPGRPAAHPDVVRRPCCCAFC